MEYQQKSTPQYLSCVVLLSDQTSTHHRLAIPLGRGELHDTVEDQEGRRLGRRGLEREALLLEVSLRVERPFLHGGVREDFIDGGDLTVDCLRSLLE